MRDDRLPLRPYRRTGACPAVAGRAADKGRVTVSDAPGFARQGGIIGLVMVDRRVRLEINRGARHPRPQRSARLPKPAPVVAEPAPQP